MINLLLAIIIAVFLMFSCIIVMYIKIKDKLHMLGENYALISNQERYVWQELCEISKYVRGYDKVKGEKNND